MKIKYENYPNFDSTSYYNSNISFKLEYHGLLKLRNLRSYVFDTLYSLIIGRYTGYYILLMLTMYFVDLPCINTYNTYLSYILSF